MSKLYKSNFPQNASKVFIKTSTGYYGGYGATVKDVKTIKSVAGNLQIKSFWRNFKSIKIAWK